MKEFYELYYDDDCPAYMLGRFAFKEWESTSLKYSKQKAKKIAQKMELEKGEYIILYHHYLPVGTNIRFFKDKYVLQKNDKGKITCKYIDTYM
ncbi:MAG: hypothetical protein P1P59_04545 [Treponemataceae bacterium]